MQVRVVFNFFSLPHFASSQLHEEHQCHKVSLSLPPNTKKQKNKKMAHEEDEDLKSAYPPPSTYAQNMRDSHDDRLAPSTMDALAEFMRERDEASRRFSELQAQAEAAHEDRQFSMADFSEDWNQSQFWYDDETAEVLASTLLAGTTKDSVIGLVSAPTVYVKLREWKRVGKVPPNLKIVLLEYDQRFAVFRDDFVHYDFANPLKGLPLELKGRFDRVLVDPPFLSEDCQTKSNPPPPP
jgi:hypothetical protein